MSIEAHDFPELSGVYFYGDYCSGTIWAATADGAGGAISIPVLDSGISLSSFGEDEAGELYAAGYSQRRSLPIGCRPGVTTPSKLLANSRSANSFEKALKGAKLGSG